MARGHNLFVGFDLVHPMENYERLARTLATLGASVKVSAMLWYLDTAMGAREVEASLREACNSGDSLIVVDASTNYVVMHNLPVPAAGLRQHWNPKPVTGGALPQPGASAANRPPPQ
jgi:hypothetical protein